MKGLRKWILFISAVMLCLLVTAFSVSADDTPCQGCVWGTVNGYRACMLGDELHICETNFPDAGFRDWLCSCYENNDGRSFSRDQLENITEILQISDGMEFLWNLRSIHVMGSDVSTPIDLRCFPHLQRLEANGAAFTSLDIQGLQELEYVDCGSAQLTKVDASGCSMLEYLNLNQCWNLEVLDLTGCTALEYLDCTGSRFAELDINHCRNLKELHCYFAENLHTLKIEQCTQLECLDIIWPDVSGIDLRQFPKLREFRCEYASIGDIDVTNCPELEILQCAGAELTRLDLSKCPKLREVWVAHNNIKELDVTMLPNLEKLDCGHNQLTKLDVTKCKNLTFLDCSGNLLQTLDLSQCKKLVELSCIWNQLGKIDLSKTNPELTWLGLQNLDVYVENVNGFYTIDLKQFTDINNLIRIDYPGWFTEKDYNASTGICTIPVWKGSSMIGEKFKYYYGAELSNGTIVEMEVELTLQCHHQWEDKGCGRRCARCGNGESKENATHRWDLKCNQLIYCADCNTMADFTIECEYVQSEEYSGLWECIYCRMHKLQEDHVCHWEKDRKGQDEWLHCYGCGGAKWWCEDHDWQETAHVGILVCARCQQTWVTEDHTEHVWYSLDENDNPIDDPLQAHGRACNICGWIVRDCKNETGEENWVELGEGVWQCTYCNFIKISKEHQHSNVEGTCHIWGHCRICHLITGEPLHQWEKNACLVPVKCLSCGTEAAFDHEWALPTCTEPLTCLRCGEQRGDPREHNWRNVVCGKESVCRDCGAVSVIDHRWKAASCTQAKTCLRCGVTQGKPIDHTFQGGNCKEPSVCRNCGAQGQVSQKHEWQKADCTIPQTCKICGMTEGEAKGHKFVGGSCTEPSTCKNCGAEGQIQDHNWKPANCKAAKRCRNCGTTDGQPESHTWLRATCIQPKTCSICGATEGKPEGHIWKKATCQEPKTCTACGETQGEPGEHKHGHWEVEQAPTDKDDGFRCRYCVWCNCELDREILPKQDQGKVENYTDPEANDYAGQVDNTNEELTDKLLTQEEKELVEQGEQISISVTVTDIEAIVTDEDQRLIVENLGEHTIGLFLDISIVKQVGDEEPQNVTVTNSTVTVTLDVPEELINTDPNIVRHYRVIRIHEGVVEILEAEYDALTGKLSFETDSFSSYTLIYSDLPAEQQQEEKPTISPLVVAAVALVAVVAIVAVVSISKKKK